MIRPVALLAATALPVGSCGGDGAEEAAPGDDRPVVHADSRPLLEHAIGIAVESGRPDEAEALLEPVLGEWGRRALAEAGFVSPSRAASASRGCRGRRGGSRGAA